jgi:hypothetical protein
MTAAAARRLTPFLITIDTEGDDLWSRPREIETRNSRYLPRFQSLCEKYGFKPSYLTNWEMANCPFFQEFAKDVLSRGAGEIGMHLHAWNSPPLVPLTDDDSVYQPYLIEYPDHLVREKIRVLTNVLEELFGVKMRSHRAGRWGFNEFYARTLAAHGYHVDCTVTPRVSWVRYPGDPRGSGGTDYTPFPDTPYLLDLDDIRQPGNSALLEVPITIVEFEYSPFLQRGKQALARSRIGSKVAHRLFPCNAWLRPDGSNYASLCAVLKFAKSHALPYVEFMLHSSELMPGGSPTFRTERSIERLYRDLERLFSQARTQFQGATLSEYYERHLSALKPN